MLVPIACPPRSGRARVTAVAIAVVALLASGTGCNSATAPLPADSPPRELSLRTYTGWDLKGVTVQLYGDTVVAYRGSSDGPAVARRVPTGAEWRAFWRTVADAGVRGWPDECSNRGVADGGTLTYALAWADGRRGGAYYAAFPTAAGACSRDGTSTRESRAFQNAVYALAGLPAG